MPTEYISQLHPQTIYVECKNTYVCIFSKIVAIYRMQCQPQVVVAC